jgi:flagellar export protein FliJ
VPGPSFQFRLERVRSLRERKQQLAEQELGRALRGHALSEHELHLAEEHLLRAQLEQRGLPAGCSSGAGELLARQIFLERLESQQGQRARELELHSAEVTRRGAQLTVAASEHQMLKRLRERHRRAHEQEIARREQRAIDEIASVRHRRSAA